MKELIEKFYFKSYRSLPLIALIVSGMAMQAGVFGQDSTLAMVDKVSMLDFGRQVNDAPGAAEALTFTNGGSGQVTILRVAVTGMNAADFSIAADGCSGQALAPADLCTVTLNFSPSDLGTRSARLSFTTDNSRLPLEMPISGYGLDPARPERSVGPVDLRFGYPTWYQDETGLRLALCIDQSGFCLGNLPDPVSPPSVSDALINFPGEAFWWYADAKINRPIGGKVLLVLSKEAAFVTGAQRVGDQIVFDRVRIRVDKLVAGQTYRVTHPFGVSTLKADSKGEINVTEDIGCLNSPCDFHRPMSSSLKTFLRWDPAIGPPAPAGYIGDPNINHAVTGSPFATNYFKVEGPNAGGPNINVVQTTLFSVQGKLF